MSRPPLFCIHPIGGNIFGYYGLARYLERDQPVYALRARGLDGIQQPHQSIDDMARDYLAEVRQVQQHGPYFLCGHSFGGLVAYEMARQLNAQGEKTALLAIFDSRKPVLPPSPLVYGGHLLAKLQLGTFARKGWRRLNRWAWRAKVHLAEAFYKLTRRPLPRELAHIRACDYCTLAARRYAPRAYPGRLIFFRAASQTVPAAVAKTKINWEELARGGVETHVVSCEHASMLSEPHVQVVAAKLKACLETAQKLVPVESQAG
jgi:thioesterase domain-containing protein